ncbi:MAG: hypothetical protein GY938_24365 [Ketobacter sp.]|nr:hypothetical protein [Ketobacter sp.]
MVHGQNPHAMMCILMLGSPDIPRFRDAYIDDDEIAIYTRTGGGNRTYYESAEDCKKNYPEYFFGPDNPSGPWNSDLRDHPGYLRDEDDEFDSTYATFYYSIPESFQGVVDALKDAGMCEVEKPNDKWVRVLKELNSRELTPDAKKALDAMKPLMKEIQAFVSGKGASDG